jgi:hypothetical protein
VYPQYNNNVIKIFKFLKNRLLEIYEVRDGGGLAPGGSSGRAMSTHMV